MRTSRPNDDGQPEAQNERRPLHIRQQSHRRRRPTDRLAGHVASTFASHLAEGRGTDVSGADCSAYFLQFFFLLGEALRARHVHVPRSLNAMDSISNGPLPATNLRPEVRSSFWGMQDTTTAGMPTARVDQSILVPLYLFFICGADRWGKNR